MALARIKRYAGTLVKINKKLNILVKLLTVLYKNIPSTLNGKFKYLITSTALFYSQKIPAVYSLIG